MAGESEEPRWERRIDLRAKRKRLLYGDDYRVLRSYWDCADELVSEFRVDDGSVAVAGTNSVKAWTVPSHDCFKVNIDAGSGKYGAGIVFINKHEIVNEGAAIVFKSGDSKSEGHF
ncbi:hypothetical protein Ddye_000683 [Dipteronia dyeriana]|uniref:Uncharacterized protein n=1 Tax=Dipteronia dyeriana TaxID=168575 RepID=A0AAE0CSU4_9ROSI|nr:hypothetical protein Ddye_000683 [Dipteronia dyeriana]